ncbi:dihydroorotase [Meiothermus hypogaeus]|uniref:Allantoinase n=2 Tax=Meiothermus hypogaeus TaxID=884155 RepID=A0A511QYT1_9DEIN|nr:dihydroorotase family protein [Meiothermus hypogaeus]RIH80328.1 L-hydantoinase [Meiothermus hypogaeus]GEM82550.1 allantoinase [Meiothermus hypogaeus NBRC 106114]GIW36102.1 MAG: allantoinase [Meiothermus sp.]
MIDLLIRGAAVITPEGQQRLDVAVQGDKIAALLEPNTPTEAKEVVDATGKHLLPGAIDIHFHVRAPAYPVRGTWESETRAAAAGGVTTVFEMPISKPCCATPEIFVNRREQGKREAVVNFALYGAPGMLRAELVQGMAAEGAIAYKIFTTDPVPNRLDEFEGLCVPEEWQQLRALELVKETGLVTVVHAESQPLMNHYTALVKATGRNDASTHGESRPPVVEALAISKIATLNDLVGTKLHIAHVTSKHALQTLRKWQGHQDISGETCPQYLLFTEQALADFGSYAKINPPLRTPSDIEALWEGIRDGSLISVTTDHSPFTVEEKERARADIWAAPPGAPGVEFLVPMMLDAAARGLVTLEQAVALISSNGAKRFGIYGRKGLIAKGADADLTLVDLQAKTVVDRAREFSQSRNTDYFFHGKTFQGRVVRTIVNGKTVFLDGEVLGKPGDGRFVRP